MSSKRSRATYEADQRSTYVVFGTPLPLDPDSRDDGSYVPIWKQEVRDERGRKRLHGAFTGGWSAGYFNTVGSKEGWMPSTFVSSRTNRRKDNPDAHQQRPEDFMDEEDLAEAEEARKIQTKAAFSGLGSTENDALRAGSLMGLFRAEGETMGTKLLKKMGWKEGQGVGPKVRRAARLDLRTDATGPGETYLFAPEDIDMVRFVRKTDQKGLGYSGEAGLAPIGRSSSTARRSDSDSEEDMGSLGRPKFSIATGRKKQKDKPRGGIGIGVLNDTGSDDEDPFEVGPRISYNRVIGGDQKKKKKATTTVNPSVKAKPVFAPKRSSLAKVALGVRKCHDGRLPLDGFVFGKEPDALIASVNAEGKYPPPKIPEGWVSSRATKGSSKPASAYVSTADAAKASALDPKSRAALLGEQQLPGKSVFDFMSAASRERLAAVTGRTDLPPALGEVPAGYTVSQEDRLQELLSRVPQLGKETAVAAISRGVGGGGPYSEDEGKRSRYIAFLEYQAGYKQAPAPKAPRMTDEEWFRELMEFYNCARIFKPMTGFMASRFTTSTSTKPGSTQPGDREVISRPPPKPQNPAEEAAKLGMFGPMTRSVSDFYPTRLLCKRFNVKPPMHVQPDDEPGGTGTGRQRDSSAQFGVFQDFAALHKQPMFTESVVPGGMAESEQLRIGRSVDNAKPASEPAEVVVDPSRNDALEGTRAGDEVFKAIFGDSDDDE